jgi:hypothetical protein
MDKGASESSAGEEPCSAALEHVCLLVGAGIQLTAFSEERPAVCQVQLQSHVGITYVTRCVRETSDEVWHFF